MRNIELLSTAVSHAPHRLIAFAAVFLCFASSAIAAYSECSAGASRQEWIRGSISAWQKVSSESLKLGPKPLPWLILFDEECVYHLNSEGLVLDGLEPVPTLQLGNERLALVTFPHHGTIKLPANGEVPARLLSFAAPYGDAERSFVVSALPSIWRNAEHLRGEPNVDALAKSVFIHEVTHTLHHAYFPKIDALEKQLGSPQPIDDDVVQNQFGKTSAFSASVAAEIELLYSSAAAKNRASRRSLARKALKKINDRRNKYFKRKKTALAGLEDIFLSMEGTANWAAYRSALNDGLEGSEAVRLIRRDGKYWSQDLGLALFLAVDGLLPDWQKRAFGPRPATALELLRAAVN